MERKVAVIGSGLMGAGIAGEFARAEHEVALVDTNAAALEHGMRSLEQAQQTLVDAGIVTETEAVAATDRIRPTSELSEACADTGLVIEAIYEDLALKQEVFSDLDRLSAGDTILASNTSGLSISRIAEATGRPEKIVGMHFWNPPHIVPLVEVTKGTATADETADEVIAVCRRLGKKPILVRHDIPGFVGNRLQFAVFREAIHLVEQGVASPEDIDLAMTAGPGLRYGLLGPMRTADLGGLDVFHAISGYLNKELNSAVTTSPALEKLVDQGKLGAKSGEGFYTYGNDDLDDVLAVRDRILLGFLEVLKREGSNG